MSTPTPDTKPAPFNPWRGRIALLTLPHVVGTVGYMSVMAMAPVIRGDLGLTATHFGLFMSALYTSQGLAAVPAGLLSDRLGVGWSLAVSMFAMAGGTAMFAAAGGLGGGLAAMFVLGLGYSMVNPATAKGVLEWFPRKRRATAMGVKQLGVPLGGVLGAGAGALVVVTGWQGILWAIAALSLAAGTLWLPLARRPTRAEGGWRGVRADLTRVIGNRSLRFIYVATGTFNSGQSSLFAYLTLFLRDAAGVSQPFAGLCMALAQSASAAGRVGFSYVSDAAFGGRRKGVTIVLLLAAVLAMATAALVDPGWPRWGLIGLSVALGGTVAAYAALILAMTAEATEPRLAGAAIGANGLAWSLGGMVGPPLFGAVLDATGAYGNAWLVAAAITVAGVVLLGAGFREGGARADDARVP